MKRNLSRWISLLFTAALLTALCLPALAEAEDGGAYVWDDAGLLTEEQYTSLNTAAAEVSETYQCGVYLYTMDDFNEYSDSGDPFETAQELYLDLGMGYGSEGDGILLMMSMSQRKMALAIHGTVREYFGSSEQEDLKDEFKDDFGDDRWYDGFEDYIETCDIMLYDWITPDTWWESHGIGVVICVVISFLLAFLVRFLLKNQLKSVKKGLEAGDYIPQDGFDLRESWENYTHTTVTRVYDPPSNHSDSGGGDFSGGSDDF